MTTISKIQIQGSSHTVYSNIFSTQTTSTFNTFSFGNPWNKQSRVRDTIQSVIYLCCEDKAIKDWPTTQQGLEDYLYNYANIARESDFFDTMHKLRKDILGYDIFKREYEKNAQYWLVVDYFRKRHLSRNSFPNRLMGYLSVQRWTASRYEVEEGELEYTEDQRAVNKEIIRAHKMETTINTAAEYRKQFSNIPANREEYELLRNKKRKTEKVKMRMNLFQIKQVLPDEDLEKMNDEKLIALTKYWSAFLFAKEFRESEMTDPIEYCKEQFHRVGHVNANNLHQQFRRDWLVRARYILELLNICGFSYSDVGDKSKMIELKDEVMTGVTNYIVHDRLNNFHTLFAVPKDPAQYEYVKVEDKGRGKQRFSTLMTKLLKHLGLKFQRQDKGRKRGARSRNAKKRKKENKGNVSKYSLQTLFDVK